MGVLLQEFKTKQKVNYFLFVFFLNKSQHITGFYFIFFHHQDIVYYDRKGLYFLYIDCCSIYYMLNC